MKIVCDDKIPYIREALASLADDVVYLPGVAIAACHVRDADALIVRTRTRCDANLLAGSKVQLVVTATIGYDHLDTAWLEQAGIAWTNCPGCNASSVAQWVRNSLLVAQRQLHIELGGMTLGIVGYGHVGRQVAHALQPYVKDILLNDPPLKEGNDLKDFKDFKDLKTLQQQADIITFHTPLTKSGHYPTHYLADDNFFNALARPIILINAARGGVVNEKALLRAMDNGKVVAAIIDTWEDEPLVNSELLQRAIIATPHIAGYSADGKANASRMAVEAVAKHFGLQADTSTIVPPQLPEGDYSQPLALYNPTRDSDMLKANPADFELLRGNYSVRREHNN